MRRTVAVSTPGKLILMGEHAVVYGRPALIAAIDLRLTARFSPADEAGVHLDLPGLAHHETLSWADLRAYARSVRERWEGYARQPAAAGFSAMRGEDPAHVVKVALGEVAELLEVGSLEPRSSAGLHLRVDSELPIGSGFGSSAATATAVIAGCFAFFGRPADPGLVERLALEVERRQHGLPSGVDGATILHGGVLWARKLPEGGLEIEKIAARSPLLGRLRVYDTGTPADSTGAVVAAVRERRDRDPVRIEGLLDRMEAAARAFRAGLEKPEEDPDRTLHLIRENEACLEALGVVPEEARAVVRRVEAEGGAAKISGAGSLRGPGAGSLLVYHPQPERIAGWSFLRPFPFYPVHLGASGFREEDSG
jgi:mevalonate kinase